MNLAAVPDPEDDFAAPDPHDTHAEQAVLGAMLLSAAAAAGCLSALSPDDFYRPSHQLIFAAIRTLVRADQPADAVTLFAHLEDAGELRTAGGAVYLHTLIASVPTAANAGYYARIVRDRAIRRRLLEAGRRIIQMALESDTDAHGLTEQAVRETEAARDAGQGDDVTTPTIAEFLDVSAEDDSYDWVVPGLLERGDRFVLTGTEGAGKSTLFRQLAVTIAAGIHPFSGDPIEPMRVLLDRLRERRSAHPPQDPAPSHPGRQREVGLSARTGCGSRCAPRDSTWLPTRTCPGCCAASLLSGRTA